MGKIKAGVVVVTKFCRAGSRKFQKYIDYIDREEAVRTDHSNEFNLYADYMGNPEKTTGLFTAQKDDLNMQDKRFLKKGMKTAQEKGSLMWQTVISFDNQWLNENGIYDSVTGFLDEKKLKEVTRNAVGKMLKNEGLENALWSAAIHYNTDNIHIHIATVETDPMRQKKEYTQYRYVERDGRKIKEPIFNSKGEPLRKMEYVGRFKGKSIEKCKSSVVNQILNEKEANQNINHIIRGKMLAHKKENPLVNDKEFRNMFLELYLKMPNVDRKMWNYNSNIMKGVRKEIDELTTLYLNKYHIEEFKELQVNLKIQELQYKTAYGNSANGNNYSKKKIEDLYSRMGNAILKEIKDYDREQKFIKSKEQSEYQVRSSGSDREAVRIGWLLSSALIKLKKSFRKEWEKELNEREHEKLSAGDNEIDY